MIGFHVWWLANSKILTKHKSVKKMNLYLEIKTYKKEQMLLLTTL